MNAREEIREILRIKTKYEDCLEPGLSVTSALLIVSGEALSWILIVLGICSIVELTRLESPTWFAAVFWIGTTIIAVATGQYIRQTRVRLRASAQTRVLIMASLASVQERISSPTLRSRVQRYNALVDRYAILADSIERGTLQAIQHEARFLECLQLIKSKLLKKKTNVLGLIIELEQELDHSTTTQTRVANS